MNIGVWAQFDSLGGLGGRNTSHQKALQEDIDWALPDFRLDRSRLPGPGVLLFYRHPNDNDNYFVDPFSPRTTTAVPINQRRRLRILRIRSGI